MGTCLIWVLALYGYSPNVGTCLIRVDDTHTHTHTHTHAEIEDIRLATAPSLQDLTAADKRKIMERMLSTDEVRKTPLIRMLDSERYHAFWTGLNSVVAKAERH